MMTYALRAAAIKTKTKRMQGIISLSSMIAATCAIFKLWSILGVDFDFPLNMCYKSKKNNPYQNLPEGKVLNV